jgi:hypothetical protein
MSIKNVKRKDVTACNHIVLIGFYSAPAEEIYKLEVFSTDHRKGLLDICPNRKILIL